MALSALLLDVDGTLADTERDGHRVAFERAFAEAGLGWRWDEALYGELLQVTGGKERIRFYLDRHRPDWPRPPDLDGLVARLHAAKTRHYGALVEAGAVPLRPGVARLVRAARAAGVRLGIATTTTPANVTALLEHGLGPGAPGWFDVIAAGDVVPAKKPAPDVYVHALAALRLPASECLAIEDSTLGLRAALGAGITTVVTPCDYTRGQDFEGAALVVDHLGEPERPFEVLAAAHPEVVGAARLLDLALAERLLA